MTRRALWLLPLAAACDNSGEGLTPALTDAPGIVDLGELRVVPIDEYAIVDEETERQYANPDYDPTQVPDAVHYGELGALENPGQTGGATFSFRGTGGRVCVMVDPESMFWTTAIGPESTGLRYKYEDDYLDDADLDLSVGLTAYYTGSPGVEIGDFIATYTDASGQDHSLEFNECIQEGYGGTPDVHAGRATMEACTIATAEREGILFTGVLKTFALPIRDSKARYAVGVYEVAEGQPCSDIVRSSDYPDDPEDHTFGECIFPNEMEDEGEPGKYSDLEHAFCRGIGKVNDYCQAHIEDPDIAAEDRLCFEPEE